MASCMNEGLDVRLYMVFVKGNGSALVSSVVLL